jgi:molybdate transport system substrate-binding protein
VNSSKLTILSGGAAQGLVGALAAEFKAQSGCEIDGTFGAVGAMRDKLLSGTPTDLLILTRALIGELGAQGLVAAGSAADIGTVQTAVAVRSGEPLPDVGNAAGLRAALLAADAIYFPDPKLATAGIHFARVIERLGIAADVASRIKTYPNGATAMRELAAARGGRPIGCTQVTEILSTPGAQLVAPLPEGFELATVYTAGVCKRATLPEQAHAFATLLAGDAARAARERAGFV